MASGAGGSADMNPCACSYYGAYWNVLESIFNQEIMAIK